MLSVGFIAFRSGLFGCRNIVHILLVSASLDDFFLSKILYMVKIDDKNGEHLVENWQYIIPELVFLSPPATLISIIYFLQYILGQNNSQNEARLEKELDAA